MSDPTPARPRLASVSGPPDEPAAAPEMPEPAAPPRRRLGLVLALGLVAAVALALQTGRVRSLEARNAVLAGELFTARTALEAYAARFAKVRETVGGLEVQLEQLQALVNEDPLTREPSASAAPSD